jgi:hypothetical protein
VHPDLPLYGVTTMESVLASSLAQRRFRMLLIGVFAGTALLLAAVGLYGVVSFTVGQRTREIGIRMALGAARNSVVAQVVRQGLARVFLGIVLGLLASLATRRAMESQIFGVSAADPGRSPGKRRDPAPRSPSCDSAPACRPRYQGSPTVPLGVVGETHWMAAVGADAVDLEIAVSDALEDDGLAIG